ncbi:hypothetical protein Cfor_12477 [Coptotermes formosanus]|uniref:ADP-ribosylation factor GTPase-activating protein 2 n=1 Tax=Coptotermes formosanus TaxID=36987 RepID=A0A6L2Q054_COPFO|nr:hypothetical protein Cfor_12477 [Coptotermes formosanus]
MALIPIGQFHGLFQHICQKVAYSANMKPPAILKLLGCNCVITGSATSQFVATGCMDRLLDLGSHTMAVILSPQNMSSPSVLHLDSACEQAQPEEKKEEDFFTSSLSADNSNYSDENDHLKAQTSEVTTADPAMNLMRGQPNVETALITQPDSTQQELRKPTIGSRKQQTKRSGLGAKKGGLGAQKVKANFAEIEREAAMADQLKVQAAEEAKLMAEKTAEEEQKQIASMRLAYQDLSLQQKKEQEKLKHVDPVKAQQIERLGMGFASRTGVSHSAVSDMKTIEQESPNKVVSSSARSVFDRDSDRDGFFDDFHVSSPSLGQPSSSSHTSEDRPVSRTDPPSSSSASFGNEAQKKFGSAKAISSEQFFGDSADNNWERKANLSRFEGSLSISSAEYFGTGSSHNSSSGSHLTTPDLEDVKESVRQGVTKVAGKLSSLANGVMLSIQVSRIGLTLLVYC